MAQPARQASRRIVSNQQQHKSTKLFKITPEIILFSLFFIWLVVCVQFYRRNLNHTVPQQKQEHQQYGDNDNNDPSFPEHYMTFSTACSASQNWQSFMFFYYAHKVSQPGYVIRIASGCSQQQKDEVLKFHKQAISKLSNKFSVHFTPDFSKISNDNYKYYNKPFGIQHWLQYGLKYQDDISILENSIIMILDPDMILLRPLVSCWLLIF